MRRWVIPVAVLAVIAAGIVFVAIHLDSWLKDNRQWLAEQAQAAIGRPISFDGIGVSFRGGLGAKLTNLRIAADDGSTDLFRARRVDFVLKLLPALFGRYQISRLRVRDGVVHFVDRNLSPPIAVDASDIDLSARDVGIGVPLQIDLAAALPGSKTQNLRVSGTAGPISAALDYAAAPLDLRVDVEPLTVEAVSANEALAPLLPEGFAGQGDMELHATVFGSGGAPSIVLTLDTTGAALSFGTAFAKPRDLPLVLQVQVDPAAEEVDIPRFAVQVADSELSGSGVLHIHGAPIRFEGRFDGDRLPFAAWAGLVPLVAGLQPTGVIDAHLGIDAILGAGSIPVVEGSLTAEDIGAQLRPGVPLQGLSTVISFERNQIQVPPTRFSLGDSAIELEAMVEDVKNRQGTLALRSPELKSSAFGDPSAGVLKDLDVRATYAEDAGALQLQADVRSAGGRLRGLDYSDLNGRLELRQRHLLLRELTLRAAGGSCRLSGTVDVAAGESPAFDLDGSLRGMQLEELAARSAAASSPRLGGRLDTDLHVRGRGAQWPAIRRSLVGSGRATVRDGVVYDVNVASSVLGGITGMPGLAELISPRVRNKYPDLFRTADAHFQSLGGTLRIAEERMRTDDLTLVARDYSISAAGWLGFDGTVDLSSKLRASRQLSTDIARDVGEARYLTDASGCLEVPFRLTGTVPRLRAQPDASFIARALQRALVGEGLNKLLGKPKGGSATPGPEEELLRRGLERLFH